jgi:hypothetical protein
MAAVCPSCVKGHQMTPQEDSITIPLKSSIDRHFPYLFEKWGFEFIDPEKNFGGNVVMAQSECLRIRFIRDRADFFVDVGPAGKPERWIELFKIIDLLGAGGHVHVGYKYKNKIMPVSRLLEKCLPEIQTFFSE